jgi:DNA-binding MarR family transcriptional regulator
MSQPLRTPVVPETPSLLSRIIEIGRVYGPDLSLRQLAVLMTCHSIGRPQTIRGLAEAIDIQKPAVTRAVDALEKFGLATRIPDPADQRSVLVVLTKRGTALGRALSSK